jgi:hypothetical protein
MTRGEQGRAGEGKRRARGEQEDARKSARGGQGEGKGRARGEQGRARGEQDKLVLFGRRKCTLVKV